MRIAATATTTIATPTATRVRCEIGERPPGVGIGAAVMLELDLAPMARLSDLGLGGVFRAG